MNKKGIIIAICVLIFLFIASLVTKYIDTANEDADNNILYKNQIAFYNVSHKQDPFF